MKEAVEVDPLQLSVDDRARLAEAEPAFVQRAVRVGVLEPSPAGGFGAQDANRLRFLKAWDAAGLSVEAIAGLIRRGELPFSFLTGPTVAVHPRLPSTYQAFCEQRGVQLSLVQRLYDALGFAPPAVFDGVREDDLVVIELLQQLVAAGAEESATLRLLRVYADAFATVGPGRRGAVRVPGGREAAPGGRHRAGPAGAERRGRGAAATADGAGPGGHLPAASPARVAGPLDRPPRAHPGGQRAL